MLQDHQGADGRLLGLQTQRSRHRDQYRPTGLITHTYRKLNDLTRHLKFIIRSVTGQRQSIFKRKKKHNINNDTNTDDVLPYILAN